MTFSPLNPPATNPPDTKIFAREIRDLTAQVENEWVEQSVGATNYHAGYLAALKKVQELIDVYGWLK